VQFCMEFQGGHFLENREKSGNLVHHGEVREFWKFQYKWRNFFRKKKIAGWSWKSWCELRFTQRSLHLKKYKKIQKNTSLEKGWSPKHKLQTKTTADRVVELNLAQKLYLLASSKFVSDGKVRGKHFPEIVATLNLDRNILFFFLLISL